MGRDDAEELGCFSEKEKWLRKKKTNILNFLTKDTLQSLSLSNRTTCCFPPLFFSNRVCWSYFLFIYSDSSKPKGQEYIDWLHHLNCMLQATSSSERDSNVKDLGTGLSLKQKCDLPLQTEMVAISFHEKRWSHNTKCYRITGEVIIFNETERLK